MDVPLYTMIVLISEANVTHNIRTGKPKTAHRSDYKGVPRVPAR